jgi:hypothetical protein
VTKAALPAGSKTDAVRLRSARQRDRLHDAQRRRIDDADRSALLFVTQMRPSGATATLRGAVPTSTSRPSRWSRR